MKMIAAFVIALILMGSILSIFERDDTTAYAPKDDKLNLADRPTVKLSSIKHDNESGDSAALEKSKPVSNKVQQDESLPEPREVVKKEIKAINAESDESKGPEMTAHQERVDVFEKEEKDTYWSEGVEQQLMSLFDDDKITANMQSMDCRTTLCKIYLSNVSGDDLNQLRQKISDQLAEKIADPSFEVHEDGSMVMYLSRENFTRKGG